MKNFLLGVFAVLIIGGLAYGAYYLGTRKQDSKDTANIAPSVTESQTVTATPSSKITPTTEVSPTLATQNDAELIKAALFKKNNWPADDSINVTVSTNDGIYASGTAGGQGGGGYFFAAKTNGEWVIVADGNGTISCASLANYPNFPKTLIPECYDEKTGTSVKR